MTRGQGMAMGVVFGLMIGLILVVILLKFANKDHRTKTEYDERQKEIRNKGYVVGFYSLVAVLAIESLWAMTGAGFPLPDYIMYFASIMLGITVMCSYTIWNGVYWGMNNDRKKYAIIIIIGLILNIFPIASALVSGQLLSKDPAEALPWMNVIVIAMFIIIGIVALIRKLVDMATAAGEED